MNTNWIENSMMQGAQAQIDREDGESLNRDELEKACHALIKAQAILSLNGNGSTLSDRVIPTHKRSVCWSALTMVQDQLGGARGDDLLIEMLILIRGIARSTIPGCGAYADMADDVLCKFAEYHADYFASDLADEVEDGLKWKRGQNE